MLKQIRQVEEFHKVYKVHLNQNDRQIGHLRNRLIQEEAKEVEEELLKEGEENIPELAKELADLLYVVYGTISAYGLTPYMEAIFDEVHKSNMSKIGPNGKPIFREDGKIMKGENYKEADVRAVLYG